MCCPSENDNDIVTISINARWIYNLIQTVLMRRAIRSERRVANERFLSRFPNKDDVRGDRERLQTDRTEERRDFSLPADIDRRNDIESFFSLFDACSQ